jgi:1,2-phenylacetyl-CoA epoxidase PaaB subunit
MAIAISEQLYWVFARAERGQPLAQIGIVKAATEKLAFVYARQNYTERHWDELYVVPKRAFFSVTATIRDREIVV